MSNILEKTRQVLFLTDFELRKLLRQKQGYAGIAVITLLISLCLTGVMLKIKVHGDRERMVGRLIKEFVNGFSFSETVLFPGIYILLPMIIGIFAASSLAGEFQAGLIRTISLRSVPRLSIVLSKFIALSVYSYFLILFLFLLSYTAGAFVFGPSGDMVVFGPAFFGHKAEIFVLPKEAVCQRVMLTYFFAGYSLMNITALFIMCSAIFKKMTMAVVIPLGIYFTSHILDALPFMDNLHRYLPTRYLMIWKYVMAKEIMWDVMMSDGIFLAVYTVSYLIIASIIINSSDL